MSTAVGSLQRFQYGLIMLSDPTVVLSGPTCHSCHSVDFSPVDLRANLIEFETREYCKVRERAGHSR